MSTKHQIFKIKFKTSKYSEDVKKAIVEDVIDFVTLRTRKGKDKNNKTFKKGYSKGYAKSLDGKTAGKRAGATPNLKLSGDMLHALGEYEKIKTNHAMIGYKAGSEENSKADGNVRGTYGKSRGNSKLARDFMGIADKDLNKILDRYPIENEEKQKKSVKTNEKIKKVSLWERLSAKKE